MAERTFVYLINDVIDTLLDLTLSLLEGQVKDGVASEATQELDSDSLEGDGFNIQVLEGKRTGRGLVIESHLRNKGMSLFLSF